VVAITAALNQAYDVERNAAKVTLCL
jgi:hypothetical protein